MVNSNENGIAIITPLFEEKDDCACACSYEKRKMLEIHVISSDLAPHTHCGRILKSKFASWMPS